jgi:HSP20 family molecular chaperone IbpA
MSTLFLNERSPFDILVRNLFQEAGKFSPLAHDTKVAHPVDVIEVPSGVQIDIACTGIPKEEIEIIVDGNNLKVNYEKSKVKEETKYLHRGIAKRSFNLGWKIDSKYDLSKAEANFINGLLKIDIPFAKGSAPRSLKIK